MQFQVFDNKKHVFPGRQCSNHQVGIFSLKKSRKFGLKVLRARLEFPFCCVNYLITVAVNEAPFN